MMHCEHGFTIDYPLELTATRCPECYEERPPHVPENEFGNHPAFAYCRTIRRVIRQRGWRGDAEDLFNECRFHLIEKSEVLRRVAEQGRAPQFMPFGWNSFGMRGYVAILLKNFLIDRQLRDSEWKVRREKVSIVTEEGEAIPIPDARGIDTRVRDIKRALTHVNGTQREAFLARFPFINGGDGVREWCEVAAIVGASEKTARRRVQAAEDAVREVLA